MPNPIRPKSGERSRRNEESGAEITEEMQSRLMLGEAANSQVEEHASSLSENTIAGRAAAVR